MNAIGKNKQALIGDGIGLAAAVFLPGGKATGALIGLAVGAGTLANTAMTSAQDRPGLSAASLTLGAAGFQITSAGPLAEAYSATSTIAESLPGVGQIVAGGALVLDAINVAMDYKSCK